MIRLLLGSAILHETLEIASRTREFLATSAGPLRCHGRTGLNAVLVQVESTAEHGGALRFLHAPQRCTRIGVGRLLNYYGGKTGSGNRHETRRAK
jgi:hypothetical protein